MTFRRPALAILLPIAVLLVIIIASQMRSTAPSAASRKTVSSVDMPITNSKQDSPAEAAERAREVRRGKFHKPLLTFMDHPGIDSQSLQSLAEDYLIDSTPVIGIEVDGEAMAFVMEKMMDPKAHIVNLNFNHKKSISVTYCYLVDCVRVLAENSEEPIPLHVGGLDVDKQMVFLLNGERYSQMSPELPLADYPFKRTSLGKWKRLHPDTQICMPPSRASIEHRIQRIDHPDTALPLLRSTESSESS